MPVHRQPFVKTRCPSRSPTQRTLRRVKPCRPEFRLDKMVRPSGRNSVEIWLGGISYRAATHASYTAEFLDACIHAREPFRRLAHPAPWYLTTPNAPCYRGLPTRPNEPDPGMSALYPGRARYPEPPDANDTRQCPRPDRYRDKTSRRNKAWRIASAAGRHRFGSR
jgi:hypothetical protein